MHHTHRTPHSNVARLAVAIAAATTLAACAPRNVEVESEGRLEPTPMNATMNRSASAVVASWPMKPRETAMSMIEKYGEPDKMDDRILIWNDKGPYSKIVLVPDEQTHLFPVPHTDFLSHTVKVTIPNDKLDELAAFDGSLWFHRTRGEFTAQCDLEAHNNIALNLGHDIAMGKRTVEQGRTEYLRLAMAYKNGDRTDPYLMTLIFEPMPNAADPGMPMTP